MNASVYTFRADATPIALTHLCDGWTFRTVFFCRLLDVGKPFRSICISTTHRLQPMQSHMFPGSSINMIENYMTASGHTSRILLVTTAPPSTAARGISIISHRQMKQSQDKAGRKAQCDHMRWL